MENGLLWEKRLMASATVYCQGCIWFFNEQKNVMMKLNPQDWTVEIVCGLNRYEPDNDSSTDSLIEDSGILYKLELTGKRVLVCDIESKMCYYVEIDCNYSDWGNFSGFAKHGNNLFIFPSFLKPITKITIPDLTVSKIEQNYLQYKDVGNEKIFCRSIQREHEMWLFSRSRRIVLRYDMRNDTACLEYLPQRIEYCIDVVAEYNDFYILDTNNAVFKWNVENNSVDLQWENSNFFGRKREFGKLIVTKNRFLLLPSLGSDILIINRGNNKMIINEDYPDDFKYLAPENWAKYLGCCEDKQYFYFPMRSANYILLIDKESGILSWHKPQIFNKEDYSSYMNYSNGALCENTWRIEDFLLKVANCDYKSMNETHKDGSSIYKYIASGENRRG